MIEKMKKQLFVWTALVAFLFSVNTVLASVPKKIAYQVLVLDQANGSIRANANVAIRIEVRSGSAAGAVVFGQDFSTQTDKSGVCSIALDVPESADWSGGNFYFVTLVDGQVAGSSQITSVPYALYAEKAQSLAADITRDELLGTWKTTVPAKSATEYAQVLTITLQADGTGRADCDEDENGEGVFKKSSYQTFNWQLVPGGTILLTSYNGYNDNKGGGFMLEDKEECRVQRVIKVGGGKVFFTEFDDNENNGHIYTKQ